MSQKITMEKLFSIIIFLFWKKELFSQCPAHLLHTSQLFLERQHHIEVILKFVALLKTNEHMNLEETNGQLNKHIQHCLPT